MIIMGKNSEDMENIPTHACRVSVNEGEFDPEKYFKYHDFFKQVPTNIDEKNEMFKKYKNGSFDFGNGMKEYVFILYHVSNTNNNNVLQYLVSKECLSDKELEFLKKYCRCRSCTHTFLKDWSLFKPCACCVGCLKSDEMFIQDHVIKETKEYVNKMNILN